MVALLSVAILLTTGYGWRHVSELESAIQSGGDIIEGPTASDGFTDILLVGNDSRTDAQGNPLPAEILKKLNTGRTGSELTDTMILMRIPNGGERAVAFSFPRDTPVELEGFGTYKLNSALARKQAAKRNEMRANGVTDEQKIARKSRAAGQAYLIKQIEQLAGIPAIDHYAEINLYGFLQLTKAVGGIKVCLKEPVSDPASGADFPAGVQKIKGSEALAFVRQRHGLPKGDLSRIKRQQVFMSQLAEKLLSSGMLSSPNKIRQVIDALENAITIDQDWDIFSFAMKMQGLAAGNIKFYTIPVRLTAGGVETDPAKVKRFIDRMSATKAKRTKQDKARAATAELRSQTTVNVYNANGVGGLAGRVRETLVGSGFDKGVSANADSMMQRSVVKYAPGEQKAAKLVAQELGGLPVEASEQVEPGTVSIFLGENYSGPGLQQSFGGNDLVRLDSVRPQQRGFMPTQQQPSKDGNNAITSAGGVPCVY